MKRPAFFISGAPRCGTTALYAYLAEHPRIFMSEVKETNYFASDFPHVQKVSFRSVDDYHRLYEKAGPDCLAAGEASPFYLFSRVAFQNIRAYDPQAKIILTLRNPIDFIQSYHQLNLSLLREDEPSLEKAWDLYESRRQGKKIPASARQPELILYQEVGQFGRYVERLFEVFPREQVKIFLFDELAASPRAVYEQTLAFVGVPSDGRTEFPQINAGFGVKSRLLAGVLHPPQALYKPLMRFVSLFGARATKKLFLSYDQLERLNTARSPRRPLDPAQRARMLEHFRPDILKLASLLGRDLSGWLA
jgi:hypothetical protein